MKHKYLRKEEAITGKLQNEMLWHVLPTVKKVYLVLCCLYWEQHTGYSVHNTDLKHVYISHIQSWTA